ncbi:MAG: TIGR02099 family protein [Pseudomonadota bacterium]|nr:TIGR02099 family protein [Pseudomonadota bacterium]
MLPAIAKVTRGLAWLVVIGIGVFAAVLLAVRLVLFPNIEHYRDRITQALAAQIHQRVTIDSLATDWDGWNPKLLVTGLRVGGPAGAGERELLELPRVALTLSWTSVLLFEPRLNQLVVDSPRLAVRRDPAGVLHVAGIEIDPANVSHDAAFTDWLLRQHEIVVRNARISWQDEQRHAPPLLLDHVTFRLETRFGGHRFGLTGNPPAELAGPIDVRGDIAGRSAREWQHATGEIYARLDFADVAAWREWLPLPLDISRGKGALRGWFTFSEGELREVVADVELADVRTRLARDVPELALTHVSGRAGWRGERPVRDVYFHQFAFTTEAGQTLPPTDLSLHLRTTDQGVVERGRLEFDRLELQPLRELAQHLPVPVRWRNQLATLSPQGTVSKGTMQWEGPADAPTHFEARADFARLGWLPHVNWPGATGLTGSFKTTSQGGELKLASRDASVSAPRLLADPVTLETLNGDASWTIVADQLVLRLGETRFTNADAAGQLHGSFRQGASGHGAVDLEAMLTRATGKALPRYVPVFMSPNVRSWLARAVTHGSVDEARLKLKGDLENFPFVDGKSGVFALDLKGHDFAIDYAERWPVLTGIKGEVRFRGAALRVDATEARVQNVAVGATVAEIADLRAPMLVVNGEAMGATRDFLRFIDESPVHEWIDDFTRAAEAQGDGRLSLKLTLPLAQKSSNQVAGEFAFLNDQLKLAGVPALSAVNGKLAFTNNEVRARDVTAETLGGRARIAVSVSEGRTRIGASGTATVQALRREFPVPFSEYASGSADWSFNLDHHDDSSTWTVESPLRGVVLDLPAPLGKTAGETRVLRMERQAVGSSPQEDTIAGTLGDAARLVAHRKLAPQGAQVDRVMVGLGRSTRPLDVRASSPGVWVRADLAEMDIDAWLAVKRDTRGAPNRVADDLALKGIDLDAGVVTAFGRSFTAMKVSARQLQDDWRLDLNAQEIAGTATWSAPSERVPNGRIVARLTRFTTPSANANASASAPPGSSVEGASTWPELDVSADSFQSKGRDLGRMELVAKPRRGEWRIERMVLANDAGRMEASGAWRAGGRPEQTTLDVAVDVKDAGAFLTRFGHPGLVQGAPTKITGQLAWAGDPSEFDYPTLTGAFRLEVGSGRFMKIEPGIGKLLGVLSLQALPRRISLDFRDIFSEGFSFDRVSGDVRIARGVMSSDDLRLIGSSAQIAIAGDTDLDKETQRLRVRVQPTLSAGVSAGAALMFLANPVVGAAIGAGSLLAQKVLRDPIEKMFSYEYAVTGSWSDPHAARTGTSASAAAPANPVP